MSRHSKEWFDECFKFMPGLPGDIRKAAEHIVNAYPISGICDPAYIANVIAMHTGRGDGKNKFYYNVIDDKGGMELYIDLSKRVFRRLIEANPGDKEMDIELMAAKIISERDSLRQELDNLKHRNFTEGMEGE